MLNIKHQFTFLFLFAFQFIFCQNAPLNMQQVGHVPTSSFQLPTDLSDIWGWVDSLGNEYAIVGTNHGTSIFSLVNPSQPVEVFFELGMHSIWRDIKTYGNYAYVTTEASNGLLIIDMSTLPSDTNLTTYYYNGPTNASWERAHNLYIDDRGYAYIFGANRGNKGCIILDLNQDPTQPVEVADINNWYVHDGMAKGDTLYLAHISDGFFTVWDVSNPSIPVMLGQHNSPGAKCHNAWVSDDGDYLYTTDEISNGFIGEFDISDLTNIQMIDETQTEPGQNVIPHNTHFLNDYIITSYYTSGVVVHDVANKGNMVEVGTFDTSPNFSGDGFYGCWGVYPWLPSGLIIASDIEDGLYVLQPNYVRGAYLEGDVRDASNNQSISGATITILGPNKTEETSTFGNFAMGLPTSGTYDIMFSHPLYQSDTVFNVPLQNDSTTFISQLLFSLTPLNLTVETKQSVNTSLPGVQFEISNEHFSYSGTTDANGQFIINGLIPGSYNILAGVWGNKDYCSTSLNITDDAQPLVLYLEEGYQDRFNLDLGWTVNASAPSGIWERVEPIGTEYANEPCNPGYDSDDCGDKAYITGNLSALPTSDDVDFGFVQLMSPQISLDPNQQYFINLSLWWKNIGGGSIPDDTLIIRVNDNSSSEILAYFTSQDSLEWVATSLPISSTIDVTDFYVEIFTADWDTGVDHLVEAGVDYFSIQSATGISSNNAIDKILVYPNPTQDGKLYFTDVKESFSYEVYNLTGELVDTGNDSFVQLKERGIYLLKIITPNQTLTRKVIF